MELTLFIFMLFFQALPFEAGDEFLIRNFTVKDGLPVNSINKMIQDEEGFIYFSTFDGLVRYDGYEFIVYNSGNTDGILSNRIAGLFYTASNEIWFLLMDGSITRKKGVTFKTYSSTRGDFDGYATHFFQNEEGESWLSTANGVYRFDSKTERFYSLEDTLLQTNTWVIEPSVKGGLFAINENGLVSWDESGGDLLLDRNEFPIPHKNTLLIRQFNPQEIWIMGGSGLFRYSLLSQQIDFTFRTSDRMSVVRNIHATGDGFYLINSSEGFYSLHPERSQIRKLSPEISMNDIRADLFFKGPRNEQILLGDDEVLIDGRKIFETERIESGFLDQEGSLWIATQQRGVFQISKSDIINISASQIANFDNIYSVVQTRDQSVWACSLYNGIFRISKDEVANWRKQNSYLSGDVCRFLYEDSDGTLYAGMWEEGLWSFKNDAWQAVSIPGLDAFQTVEAMHRDSKNRLLIGNQGPLIVQENGSFKTIEDSIGNKFNGVRVIQENRNGTLYLGTNGNGLTVIKADGNTFNYTIDNSALASNYIRDIYIQSADTLWLATENLGLNRLIFNEHAELQEAINITVEDELINNSLHKIIETPGNYLWISSNGGIMRVSLNELNQYADHEISDLFILVFDESNGMIAREANGGVQTSGMLSSDGKLWFPNQTGLTVIDLANVSNENVAPAPRPIIEEVILPDTTLFVQDLSTISIPKNRRNARVKFSAPNFSSPDRIQFRYKLGGVNENWESGGLGNEAVFTNLPPGTHEFLVQTRRDGNPSEFSEASIFITIPPTFFETIWFFLSIAVLGGLLIFGGVKYRTRVLEDRERKLQKRVDQQTRELKEAADQKSRFFSGITHELKTPLSLIGGPLSDLLDRSDDIPHSAVRKLQMMDRNNKRLQNLVDEILDVTRLNADAIRLTLQPVKILQFTKQIAGQFQSRLDRKKVRLVFHSEAGDDVVYCDPNAWERIIINLLNNAIRFSPEGSAIYVNLSGDDEQVSVRVKDEGIGIDEKDADDIFDYLYQVQGKEAAEGTGIGLYLVKGLVEHLGGSVQVRSKKGEGAEFIISLRKGFEHFKEGDTVLHEPFLYTSQKTASPIHVSEPLPTEKVSVASEEILIVEDNDDFREYLQSVLSEKYRISTASEGNEALHILQTSKPDMIISDVMMPGMNGLEFVNNLRQKDEFKHIPIIFLSAKDMDIDKEEGLSTGADIYLTKPVKSSLLLSQIAAVLRRERVLKTEAPSNAENEDPFVIKVRTIIYRQLANPYLNVDMLAEALFMSRRSLYKTWEKTDEISLNDYIKKIRLDEANVLLKEKGFNIQEAALAIGFSSRSYFSTSFKKEFGVSPSEVVR